MTDNEAQKILDALNLLNLKSLEKAGGKQFKQAWNILANLLNKHQIRKGRITSPEFEVKENEY